MIYKKFIKDWVSPDGRYKYKEGDEELVVLENEKGHLIGADIGIVYRVPKEFMEE